MTVIETEIYKHVGPLPPSLHNAAQCIIQYLLPSVRCTRHFLSDDLSHFRCLVLLKMWLFSITSVHHTLIDDNDTRPSVRVYYVISYVKLYEHKNYTLKKEG